MASEDLVARARAESSRLTVVRVDEAALEAIRAEAAELYDQLPEPPSYRRADDPARARAAELSVGAVSLLARCLAAMSARPDDERLGPLSRAIEAHLKALGAISAGDIAGGEVLWREARELARTSTPFGQFWSLAASPPPVEVYDREKGESRYDPRPEPMVSVQIVCPNTCRKTGTYAVSPRVATHQLTCSTCNQVFTAYFAEARSVESSPTGSALHYALRVDELGGPERRIEFDDASGADLAVAPRDMVVFLYGSAGTLSTVMNLSTGRVLFVAPSTACFVASAVYGPDSPETVALRFFRDRYLRRTSAGRRAVQVYYWLSPPAARIARRHPTVRAALRRVLDAVVRRIPR